MPEIQPFAGIRFNPAKISDFSQVVAPPYDVIDPKSHLDLLDRDPHNVVRLILGSKPGSPGDYEAAAALMSHWLREGTLIRDKEPCYYILRETYQLAGLHDPIHRWGIIGRVRLEPLESGRIFPHERTHSRPKEDRLRLMRAFKGNLSQVLALFDGDASDARHTIGAVFKDTPAIDFIDNDGIGRQLWAVQDTGVLRGISSLLAERNLYIADGHHRYETALAYSREKFAADPSPSPGKGYNFVMMALVGMKDPGLTILPIHRLIYGLENFDMDIVIRNLSKIFSIEPLMEGQINFPPSGPAPPSLGGRGFVLHSPSDGRYFKALLREDLDLASYMPGISPPVRKLEVTLVEKFLMMECLGLSQDQIRRQEHLEYYQDLEKAKAKAADYGQLLVIMPPTSLDDLIDVTEGRERMPQKSTFFYPKLLSGLVFYDHGYTF